ncbi:type II secretion system minor pseudopilin GspK [Pseudomonas sp. TNT2022 ID357]|uniref:Type II secretion system protein K n=1 Tax=Pseudomonas idahonensis TaxID=2942628 RepID=A0ABT5QBQ4_9PSED|nr:type II secretion system minor pseudopilin GspK [Pseudomonas idahonensis]MDD1151636.1 type II secretion system minor pseudopilin GspK [Pseudomonas idahonensis]
MNKPRAQRGVALLSVLLITALVTLVVSNMLARQRLSLASSSHLVQHQQLWQLALSGESWARSQLQEDARSEGGLLVTHLGQHWARPAPAFPIEGGRIAIQIVDLGARLNFNSALVQDDVIPRARYQRLLALAQIKPHDPAALSRPLDRLGRPLPLSDISELRQLPEVDRDTLQRLSPLVAAYEQAHINLNTASALVLASIEGIDLPTAQTLAQSRPSKGYPTVAAFLANPMLQGRDITPRGLSVNSRQFRATIDVELHGRRLRLVSDLRVMNAEQVRVQQRTLLPGPSNAHLLTE